MTEKQNLSTLLREVPYVAMYVFAVNKENGFLPAGRQARLLPSTKSFEGRPRE
jgi:hypothetical protein